MPASAGVSVKKDMDINGKTLFQERKQAKKWQTAIKFCTAAAKLRPR